MSRFGKIETGLAAHPAAEQAEEATSQDWLDAGDKAMLFGRYEAAIAHYSRALQVDGTLVEAWVGQVRSLIEVGEPEEAQHWAQQGLERFRDNPELLAWLGVALGRMGDYHRAIAYSDAALEQAGANALCWAARGDVLLVQGSLRNAKRCFMKALELGQDSPTVRLALVQALSAHEEWGEAEPLLRECVRRHPANPLPLLLWARCCHALKLHREYLLAVEELSNIVRAPVYRGEPVYSKLPGGVFARWAARRAARKRRAKQDAQGTRVEH